MAAIVLSVVGGVTGFMLGGPSGAVLGANLGGMAASNFFPKTQRVQLPTQEGPRLADLRAQTSTYGNMIPKVYGTMRLAGNVIWATDIKEVKTEKTFTQTSSGGGTRYAGEICGYSTFANRYGTESRLVTNRCCCRWRKLKWSSDLSL